MEINPNISTAPANGVFGVEAAEKGFNDFLEKHLTRYVFTPFADASCTQIPGGTVYTGQIVPIQAPERRALKWVMGADEGKIIRLEAAGPGAERNIAVYLDEPKPIVAWLVEVYGKDGLTEVSALNGMVARQFEESRLNETLFSFTDPETGERKQCRTAAQYRSRMKEVIQKTKDDAAGQMLKAVAKQVLVAVDRCDRECHAHMAARHAEIKNPNSDAPKNYSQRDRRALEFSNIRPIEEVMQEVVGNQTAAIEAIPALLEEIRREKEEGRKREEESRKLFAGMLETLGALTESSKATAAAMSAGAQPAPEPKLKKQG